MLKRYNRLLVAIYVVGDFLSGAAAFLAAYLLRFDTGVVTLFPATKGQPPFSQYLTIAPFVALLIPLGFHFQGLYRLRRGRTRVDDFFGVLVGAMLATLLGIAGTLYINTYHLSPELKAEGFLEISRPVWVLLPDAQRRTSRTPRAKSCATCCGGAGGPASASSACSSSAAAISAAWWRTGFSITASSGSIPWASSTIASGPEMPSATGACRCSAPVADVADVCQRDKVDEIYVALPIEEHVKMLGVVEFASRECIDVHVVPDLLQFIALRARLEDLDGLPIISVNDVPLRGFNSVLKRVVDIVLSRSR